MVARNILVFLFILASGPVSAGGEALPFLKLDTNARAAALGGAFTVIGGVSGAFYNPAGPARSVRKEAEFTHNEWLEGARREAAAYSHPLGPSLTAFGGLHILSSGGMKRYNAAGAETGSFSALEGAVMAGLAFGGGGRQAGISVKGLFQSADGKSARSAAADAGVLLVSRRLRAGIALLNAGPPITLGARGFSPPLTFRAGLGYRPADRIWLLADGVKAGSDEAALCSGAELRLGSAEESYYIRGGYRTGRSREAGAGLTGGLGIKSGALELDYAFSPYGSLGASHTATFGFSFGGKRNYEASSRPRRRARQAPKRDIMSVW